MSWDIPAGTECYRYFLAMVSTTPDSVSRYRQVTKVVVPVAVPFMAEGSAARYCSVADAPAALVAAFERDESVRQHNQRMAEVLERQEHEPKLQPGYIVVHELLGSGEVVYACDVVRVVLNRQHSSIDLGADSLGVQDARALAAVLSVIADRHHR